MGEWKEHKFSELLEEPVRNGIYKKKEFHGRGTKIVNMGELFSYPRLIDTEMKLVELNENEKNKCLLRNGDLIFARRSLTAEGAGKCSLIHRITEDVTFESSIIRARPNQNKVSPEFLYYYFNSPYGCYLLGTILRQVAVSGITGTDLMDLILSIPDKDIQDNIAQIFRTLDDKIDLLHRQNKTLEALAETLFRQWFVEEADESWEKGGLGDYVNVAYGKNLPTSKLLESGYPVFGGNGQIGFYDQYLYKIPQVLVSCRGEASGVVNISLPKSFVTNNSLVLEMGKNKNITFEFLKYFSLYTDYKVYVTGSAQPQITIETLNQADFILPPKNLIDNFSEQVNKLELKRSKNEIQILTLTQLRDTLLPKLMSGEVRVKN